MLPRPAAEDPLVALRREIREAAVDMRLHQRKVGLRWFAIVLYALILTGPVFIAAGKADSVWQTVETLVRAEVVFAFSAVGIALGAGARARARCRGDLRQKLAALSVDQQAEVLLPLREDCVPGLQALVRPLLREFNLPTEVTPTAAPAARGDEPAPAAD